MATFGNKVRLNRTFHIVNPDPPQFYFLMDIISEAIVFFEAEIFDHIGEYGAVRLLD